MDDQHIVQARLKEIARTGEVGAELLSQLLHRQHYDFAHKSIQYLMKDNFDDLISSLTDNSTQEWICQIWGDNGDDILAKYSNGVHPVSQFVKASDEIGLVYFAMPAPRATAEALYTCIIFLMDGEFPSKWLRRYFTLELGLLLVPSPYLQVSNEVEEQSVGWIFAEWNDFEHLNRGEFEPEPTLNNFLLTAIAEAQNGWY
jgi:hypothetical protein